MTDEDFKKIGGLMDEKLEASEKRVMNDIGDFIHQNLLPQLEEKADKSDIDRLERKLDRVIDKDIVHEQRLSDIESTPTVAHELRANKSG